MKKKNLLTLSAGMATLALLGVIISANPRSFDMARAVNTTQACAKIEFGEGTTGDSGKALTSSGYIFSPGFSATLSTCTKTYSAGSGNPARMGTTSAQGVVTFSFDSMVVTSIRLYAYQYGSDGNATVTLATSASSDKTATIPTTAAPNLDDLAGDGIYLFTGLDGGTGASSTSLTISSDGSNRFYLAKILFTINGSSSSTSSSSAMSSSAATSSSTTTSSSQASSTPYRVAPNVSNGTSAPVYAVSSSGGSYKGTLVTALTKGAYYTTYEDVAAYWQAFGTMPGNYMCADGDSSSGYSTTKAKAYTAYGESARLWFAYHRTTGYMTQVPVYNTYGDGTNEATYYEIDISTSWSSYNSNRGAERLMAMPYGLTQYGVVPVIFHTTDHYATFKEYLNYSEGWGTSFAGRSDYSMPSTVTYTIA